MAQHREHNCLAVRLSQEFVEPLEAAALDLVLATVEQFIHHYPQGEFTDRHRAAFTTDIAGQVEDVRDYIVAHYKVNTWTDAEYWNANAAPPDPLLHILDRWFRRGDVADELARQGQRSYFDNLS